MYNETRIDEIKRIVKIMVSRYEGHDNLMALLIVEKVDEVLNMFTYDDLKDYRTSLIFEIKVDLGVNQ